MSEEQGSYRGCEEKENLTQVIIEDPIEEATFGQALLQKVVALWSTSRELEI